MLKIICKLIKRIFLILTILMISGYFTISHFYKDVFMVNTWINGVYCTGKTVEEVNSELLLKTKAPFLKIKNNYGNISEINMAEVGYSEDFSNSLENQLKNQNSFKWPIYLISQRELQILPVRIWNKEALREKVLTLDVVKDEVPEKLDVKIVMTNEGYKLQDNLYNVLDPELLADYVEKCFENGDLIIEMNLSGAYIDVTPDEEQMNTRDNWEKLQKFLECKIVYDMGTEKLELNHEITSKFVLTNENGEFLYNEKGGFLINESAIEAFIDELASEYNTVNTKLAFPATRGETVMVDYVTYGTQLDAEEEKEYLKSAFLRKVSEVHVPAYLQQGYIRGKNDIGNTYIEVDMTQQKLYCYKEGEIILETDIVTGNMRRKWDTPEGVNFVYNKQKKRVLRGPGYATPVDYWMPVKGSIGIHDANWRTEFGGDIYLKNGSHGCINIPKEVMPQIYDEYEIGTPVIMFY